MHVSLTDLLTCPRCGPEHGLVLMPGEVRDRRVAEGVLGCPNCRERYAIEGGVADLREPGPAARDAAASSSVGGGSAGGEAEVVRLAALLGLAEAAGVVVLCGGWTRHASELAALIPSVEVVVAEAAEDAVGAEGAVAESAGGHTTIRVSGVLPFRTGSIRGVGLKGALAGELLAEGGRVLGGSGRLVLEPAGESERAAVEAAGLRVLAAEGGTIVAGRSS